MNKFARWNGFQWEAVGAVQGLMMVGALIVRGSHLVVGGDFTGVGGAPSRSVAAWDGAAWHSMDPGVDATISAMAPYQDQIVVAGSFSLSTGQWASYGCDCYPDCNGDGALNLADFGGFQTKFALGEAYADCNGDGVRNLADFACFQTKFAMGCP
ncbi:MAG: hypothetical protein IT437_08950 [Phycisphaerales bacterium]|nr:hypothetical protein [Phycisphaerales bacterium]